MRFALLVLFAILLVAPAARAEPKQEARVLFEQGLELSKQGSWDAALAAFLRSRELYATRGNTRNAAVALSRVGRFDEALEMFELLLREFPELTLAEREGVSAELAKLRGLVGSIEVVSVEAGATVFVDGRARGTIPLGPVRVAAGSHVVRVFRDGSAPFETRVDVAGGEIERIEVRLERLRRAGMLRVTERTGKPATLVVDGAVVGQTPWHGQLEPGRHAVSLRGDGELGTQPVTAPVRVDQTTTLTLELERLACSVRVEPQPLSALVAIDGVELGRGIWQGRLRCGGHRVEVASDGFLPVERNVTLADARLESLSIELERDPRSPLWTAREPAQIYVGLDAGALLGLGLGGPAPDGGLAGGFSGLLSAGYRFESGIGLGLRAGYLGVGRSIEASPIELDDASNPETVDAELDEKLFAQGIFAGVEVSLVRGTAWLWGVELVAGAWLAELDVRREATVLSGSEPVDPARTELPARYLVVAPGARVGRRLGRHWALSLGIGVPLLFALDEAQWDAAPSQSRPASGVGRLVAYPEPVVGRTLAFVSPSVRLAYGFF